MSKKPFFNFTFLKNNIKKQENKKILDKIYRVSQHTIQEWKQMPREYGGFNYISDKDSNIPFNLTQDIIFFLKEHMDYKIDTYPKKFIYFRVGKIERMYGLLIKNYFIALFLDYKKDAQK
ncbi:hypothetical protein [Spiroplasma endosymbiont of Glossina fuscipes fuscipes]